MENNKSNTDRLIHAFLKGDIGPIQLKELHEWVHASSQNKEYFRSYQTAWRKSNSFSNAIFDHEKAFVKFNERTRCQTGKSLIHHSIISFRKMLSYAACILISLSAGYLISKLGSHKKDLPLFSYTVEAPLAAKLKIGLPDGTEAWLNAGSVLTYDNHFNINHRNVTISGEGYFSVANNPHIPFLVTSGESQVRVIGTEFNVKNYPDDSLCSIALLKGRIEYINTTNADTILLDPDQMILYDKKNRLIRTDRHSARFANSWMTGDLFINKEKLGDISRILERAFNVDFIFENPELKELSFYGELKIESDNLSDLMDIMAATNKFSYRYDTARKEIVIKP